MNTDIKTSKMLVEKSQNPSFTAETSFAWPPLGSACAAATLLYLSL